MLIMDGPGPLCLTCADLDHLVFLGAGDAALTRRAKKASTLSAVVASVRHQDTDYDELLMSGVPREEARVRIRSAIDRVLAAWA
jgi:hypothetical protein